MKTWTVENLETRLAELGGSVANLEDPRERTRQRILDAATEHFVRFGYRRANIADIARDAGLGKGTLYLYFDSKKTLIVACVAREKLQLLPKVEAALELPATERLEAYLRAILRFALTAPLSSALVRGEQDLARLMEEIGPASVRASQGRGLALFEHLIEPLLPAASSAEQQALAAVLAAVASLPAHLTEPERRFGLDIDTFVDTYSALLARGVAGSTHAA